jgi:hypothetical protein
MPKANSWTRRTLTSPISERAGRQLRWFKSARRRALASSAFFLVHARDVGSILTRSASEARRFSVRPPRWRFLMLRYLAVRPTASLKSPRNTSPKRERGDSDAHCPWLALRACMEGCSAIHPPQCETSKLALRVSLAVFLARDVGIVTIETPSDSIYLTARLAHLDFCDACYQ